MTRETWGCFPKSHSTALDATGPLLCLVSGLFHRTVLKDSLSSVNVKESLRELFSHVSECVLSPQIPMLAFWGYPAGAARIK